MAQRAPPALVAKAFVPSRRQPPSTRSAYVPKRAVSPGARACGSPPPPPPLPRPAGRAGRGLAAPRDPRLAAREHAVEPARLLLVGAHAVDEDERVDVTFPASCERQVGAGDF